MIGEYETTKTLGVGAFGTVKLAKKKNSDQLFAIKCISKQSILRSRMGSQVKKEISIMKDLDHPNIVRVLEVLMSTEHLYIVMDFVSGGELYAKITRGGRLSDTACRRYVRQLCSALNYCHSRNVCHRDIKPENILLDEHDNVLLADFGFASIMEVDPSVTDRARVVSQESSAASSLELDEFCAYEASERTMEGSSKRMKAMSTMCGTMSYMAPEILNREKYMGDKADIWSLGVVIYVLLVGFMPFRDEDNKKSEYTTPKCVKEEASDFVSKMLILEPGERYSARRLLLHPWVENQSESVRLLQSGVNSDSWSDDTSEEELESLDFTVSLKNVSDNTELLHSVGGFMKNAGWKTRVLEKSLKASCMSTNGVVMVAVDVKGNKVCVRHANISKDGNAKVMGDLRALLMLKLSE